jgi:hypothetical protein
MVAVTVLVDPKEDVHRSSCRSHHEDGVIAVSRTVTPIAPDPSPVRTASSRTDGMVS